MIRCKECGSDGVQDSTWFEVNTGRHVPGEAPTSYYWCEACHVCGRDGEKYIEDLEGVPVQRGEDWEKLTMRCVGELNVDGNVWQYDRDGSSGCWYWGSSDTGGLSVYASFDWSGDGTLDVQVTLEDGDIPDDGCREFCVDWPERPAEAAAVYRALLTPILQELQARYSGRYWPTDLAYASYLPTSLKVV